MLEELFPELSETYTTSLQGSELRSLL